MAKGWITGIGCAVLAILCLGGCGGPGSPAIDDIRQAYAHGDYSRAYNLAAAGTQGDSGHAAEEAAYMAGMSAYKLGRLTDAKRYLTRASRSGDNPMAGDALATLGLIDAGQGLHAEALQAFLGAARRLSGQSQAHAYFYAALAEQDLGEWPQAREHLLLARAGAGGDADFARQIADRLSVTGYCLQVGAFAQEINAQHAARYWQDEVAGKQVGPPRVMASTDAQGKRLYLVQIGQFNSYAAAQTARERMRNPGAIIIAPTKR